MNGGLRIAKPLHRRFSSGKQRRRANRIFRRWTVALEKRFAPTPEELNLINPPKIWIPSWLRGTR